MEDENIVSTVAYRGKSDVGAGGFRRTYIVVFFRAIDERLRGKDAGGIDEMDNVDVVGHVLNACDERFGEVAPVGQVDDADVDDNALGGMLLQKTLGVSETGLTAGSEDYGDAAAHSETGAGQADAGAAADDESGGARGGGLHYV